MALVGKRVQSLAEDKLDVIPPEYIQPAEEHKDMGDALEVVKAQIKEGTPKIPVVDLRAFDSGNEEIRQACVESVRKAAEEWGMMHIAGHGISAELLEKVRQVGKRFFDLPIEQKEQYANNQDSGNLQGYGSKFSNNLNGKIGWTDYLFHLGYPHEKADFTIWPKEAADYIEVTKEYAKQMRALAAKMLSILSLGLGLDEGRLERELGGPEDLILQLKINYYPKCPQPDLVLGAKAHTDASALTFLHANGVPGLQVFKDGHWIVDDQCIGGTMIASVGDALEILSNGKYKGVLHRALVNKEKVRMSWAVFCEPPMESIMLAPLEEFVTEETPAKFAPRTFSQHIEQKVFKKN